MEAAIEKAIERRLREVSEPPRGWQSGVRLGDLLQDFRISIREGAVTLSGSVNSEIEKVAAENAAKSVYGVATVANKIDVIPETQMLSRDGMHFSVGNFID